MDGWVRERLGSGEAMLRHERVKGLRDSTVVLSHPMAASMDCKRERGGGRGGRYQA